MHLESFKNKLAKPLFAKIVPGKYLCVKIAIILILFVAVVEAANNLDYANEEEKRRVDISLSIFPRIVAVDNNFRSKLGSENKVQLVFLYLPWLRHRHNAT